MSMSDALLVVAALVVAAVSYIVYAVLIYPTYFSLLKDVPGPRSDSWLYGNLDAIFAAQAGIGHQALVDAYGPVVRYSAILGDERLVLTDAGALRHILVTDSYQFPKPTAIRGDLGRILGYGILFAEGDDHRRQRKIMTPAFSPEALRAMLSTFFELSYKVRFLSARVLLWPA